MGRKFKIAVIGLVLLGALWLAIDYFKKYPVAILAPKGQVATQERSLIFTATLLMLIVVVPVFILTFSFAWRYRAGNKKAKHAPDWDHNRWLEGAWWAIPGLIITSLAIITWHASYSLDPFKPISSTKPPITIQVVALQWKWLFIYPQQGIATVNFVEFPQQTPVNFEITADAPMNSFWIPQLGGQIYAMPGMSTELHLIANSVGSYRGSSANISGSGFASMDFIAHSATDDDFNKWVASVQHYSNQLNPTTYDQLAKPATSPVDYYAKAEPGLYDAIVMKYMEPGSSL